MLVEDDPVVEDLKVLQLKLEGWLCKLLFLLWITMRRQMHQVCCSTSELVHELLRWIIGINAYSSPIITKLDVLVAYHIMSWSILAGLALAIPHIMYLASINTIEANARSGLEHMPVIAEGLEEDVCGGKERSRPDRLRYFLHHVDEELLALED